jgi:hypothetical protein
MRTVLWISVVGGSLLFVALAGLVGLIYLLTAPWLFTGRRVEAEALIRSLEGAAEAEAEQERRRRAAALAVASACAEENQLAFQPTETPRDWRMLHRARRLAASAVPRRAVR